jgi:hypothetical protein
MLLPLAGSLCVPAAGQLITVNGARGLQSEPSGGILSLDFGRWGVDGSLGLSQGSIVGGGAARIQLARRWKLKLGDQNIEVEIPSETNLSYQMMARGGTLSYAPDKNTQISFFAGMAGGGYTSPHLLYFVPQIPLGALSVDHFLDQQKRILLFARALFSNQQTILGGLLYQNKELQTGFSAGTGSNQPHVEGLLNYRNDQWDIRGKYLYSGDRFQMLTLPQFRVVQEDRENIDVRWRPSKAAQFNIGRHEYLYPESGSASTHLTRGATDSAGVTVAFFKMAAGASGFESRYKGSYGSAATFFMSQNWIKRIQLMENYYRPLHSSKPVPMLTFTVLENLNRRFSLSQFATRTNGQWTASYGGGLRWDKFDINVSYATNFIPLTQGSVFKQSMVVNGHVNLGRMQFGVRTYVQPDGKVFYAYEARSFYFHPMMGGGVIIPSSSASVRLPRFLIVGTVVLEETGKPLADVPIRIGNETVYTDETGAFSLRASNKRSYRIQLQLERPVNAHYYELVSGPAEVIPGTDDAPAEARFVVRLNRQKAASVSPHGIVVGGTASVVNGETPAAGDGANPRERNPGGTGNMSN